eukprot:CAMPEP_0172382312 /NCGR_PEP_ID=MMETSP1061-20121228/281_1 /TAXON_ID=37318 /ORGANISM="Pseudo-nitzschia pungens, Strain cf. pungens" /LENGTH=229 /DNA_ID=CAMNT_0013110155 /DNA_START=29 /DNA_END=718 /DNA_ORIENTATION=+
MKFTVATFALATMAGSAAAGGETLSFDTPIPFTQFDGSCTGDVLYAGEVMSIKKMDYGSFCVADNIIGGDGTKSAAYSRLDVVACETDAIYENWSKCSDATCSDCVAEYKSYTGWDSINPDEGKDFCYRYTFSTDPIEKTTRKIKGQFFNSMDIFFHFNPSADADDVNAYVKMMDENSCIGYGPPAYTPSTGKDNVEIEAIAGNGVSGSSTLAATTAAAAIAGVTALLM